MVGLSGWMRRPVESTGRGALGWSLASALVSGCASALVSGCAALESSLGLAGKSAFVPGASAGGGAGGGCTAIAERAVRPTAAPQISSNAAARQNGFARVVRPLWAGSVIPSPILIVEVVWVE